MTDGFDERHLRSAMEHEARRARPDPRARAHVMERLDRSRRSTRAALAAAAVLVAVGGVAALALWLERGGDDDAPVVVEPPPTTTTTTAPSATTTSTTEGTTTTELEREVVVDPIDMGPTPPTRDAPPETLVAVLPDGWLAIVDTATGEVTERLEWNGDLRDDTTEGGPYGIWQVAVTADRSMIWHSRCCEPAAGSIRLTGQSDRPVMDADSPAVTMTSGWITAASYFAHISSTDEPGQPRRHRSWGRDDGWGMSAAVLSPDGQHLVVEPWPDRDSTGSVSARDPMLVVRTDTVVRSEHSDGSVSDHIVDDEPDELPSDRWTLPSFGRDGLLLVAEEGDDGTWAPRRVDIDTHEVSDAGFEYGAGTPVMQRYDGSGEWLLVIVSDDPAAFPVTGRLVWFGPDGRSGTIPGEYVSAAW